MNPSPIPTDSRPPTRPDPDRLIRRHLDLPSRLARQYRGPRLSNDDLCGEANLALVEAARKFDPAEHADESFARYAERVIRSRLREALERAPLVRMPRALERRALRGDGAHAPRPHDVAVEHLGMMPPDHAGDAEALERALGHCTAAERELVHLMVAGCTAAEAGGRMGLDRRAALALYRGARDAIELAFRERGFDLGPSPAAN